MPPCVGRLAGGGCRAAMLAAAWEAAAGCARFRRPVARFMLHRSVCLPAGPAGSEAGATIDVGDVERFLVLEPGALLVVANMSFRGAGMPGLQPVPTRLCRVAAWGRTLTRCRTPDRQPGWLPCTQGLAQCTRTGPRAASGPTAPKRAWTHSRCFPPLQRTPAVRCASAASGPCLSARGCAGLRLSVPLGSQVH